MSDKPKKGVVAVLKSYFGLKQGQTLGEFAKEIRALNEDEKTWLAEEAAKELDVELERK